MNAAGRSSGWVTFSVFGLVVMAAWTLVIKYLAPVMYLVAENAAGRTIERAPVMWDFWWVAHLVLAWLLWHRHRWARAAGLVVSISEILIVAVKLASYMARPDLSFWRLLWLTNKIYVLTFFLCFLVLLLTGRVMPGGRESERGGP